MPSLFIDVGEVAMGVGLVAETGSIGSGLIRFGREWVKGRDEGVH